MDLNEHSHEERGGSFPMWCALELPRVTVSPSSAFPILSVSSARVPRTAFVFCWEPLVWRLASSQRAIRRSVANGPPQQVVVLTLANRPDLDATQSPL